MENNENLEPESIWADGIPPQDLDEKFFLRHEEILMMAIDNVCKRYAQRNGYTIEQAIARPNYLPNVVLSKDGKTYAIAVVPCLYPEFLTLSKEARIQMVKSVKKFNAIPVMCPMGFRSVDPKRAEARLALKGDIFETNFRGFVLLTDAEEQTLYPPEAKFVDLSEL